MTRTTLLRGDAIGRLLPSLWCLILILLYLVWLPALYHHGRYLMPLLPVLVMYGVVGTAALMHWLSASLPIVARWVPFIIAGFTLALWGNGAVVYGWDMRYITDQQVRTARWLHDHTPAGTVVATHDIGAMGYFAGRRVVDMAGLITPELSRTPRDRERILATIREQGATVAAILPQWYPWLPADPRMREVFHAATDYAEAMGGDEMRVFAIEWNAP